MNNKFPIKGYFKIKKDNTLPEVRATIIYAGQPLDLTDCEVSFVLQDDFRNEIVNRSATIIDAQNGVVQYNWLPVDTQNRGSYYGEFRIVFEDGDKLTIPHDGYILVTIL